jgi:hypothetical protein
LGSGQASVQVMVVDLGVAEGQVEGHWALAWA